MSFKSITAKMAQNEGRTRKATAKPANTRKIVDIALAKAIVAVQQVCRAPDIHTGEPRVCELSGPEIERRLIEAITKALKQ